MNFAKLSFNIAIFAIACSTATLSNAQIEKCLERDGSISYSDKSCGAAPSVGHLNAADTTPAGIASLQAYEAETGVQPETQPASGETVEEAAATVETPWAHMSAKPVRYSTDVQTVSQARETLASIDREYASAAGQKLPAYR